MLKSRSLALGLASLSLGVITVATANADVLLMEDGRRIRGELVSVNRGIVLFNEEASDTTRLRRIRVNLADVRRINMTDDEFDTTDRNNNDRFGNDRYGTDRGYDYGRRERVLSVSAREPWTNAGIDIREGDTISFASSGVVTWGPGRSDDAAGEANSPYNSRRPIANRPGGALIGRIGNDIFFIGTEEGAFRARTSGRLYLGINDDQLSDNSGAFSVRVQY
jgi:hypothetical protein